jgi:ribosome maturation factor RimP
MTVVDRVRDLVLPLLAERDLDLYDLEVAGPVLKVVVDRPGGLDLDALAKATRAVSHALDEADPFAGAYTLEVTSPGLERALRTPQHFVRAVGESVKVKLTADAVAGAGDDRRLAGVLVAADDEGITVRPDAPGGGDAAPGERRLAYADIERARTVFEWGPGDKPGKSRQPGGRKKQPAPARTQGTSNEKRDPTS